MTVKTVGLKDLFFDDANDDSRGFLSLFVGPHTSEFYSNISSPI